ncbi:MAG TPA: glutamyl-tRNA reductase [Anaerolineaceae bacterium]|nr:glutamyl-tRNA reductase [Anaerolineaceae bacterium]
MEFYCLGTSHQNASLALREKFSFSEQKIKEVLYYYKKNLERFLGPKSEIVILSTCNRFEIYVTFRGDQHNFINDPVKVFDRLNAFLAEITGNSSNDIKTHFIQYQNLDAIKHLFRVACGLESQVLGEVQILGQVSNALSISLEIGTARHPLASLFQSAIHTAKRAQTETEIGKKPASISSAAVQMARQCKSDLSNQKILVIGAGEMSHLALKTLYLQGANNITILNRTLSKAVEMANQFSFQAAPLDQMSDQLKTAEIIITATSVQHPIITCEILEPILKVSQTKTKLFLDIAMPRNIEPAIRNLPNVELIDLEDLKSTLDLNLNLRKKAAKQVESILVEELQMFSHWMDVMPTVGKLHRKAEMIRRQEVEKMIQHNPNLDPQLQERIDTLTRSLVKKILHEPSTRMRSPTTNRKLSVYTSTLHFLFGLDEDENAYQVEMEKPKYD